MFTWPAAPVLAQFIWHYREQIKGKQVIEVFANDNDALFTASIHLLLFIYRKYPFICAQICFIMVNILSLTPI